MSETSYGVKNQSLSLKMVARHNILPLAVVNVASFLWRIKSVPFSQNGSKTQPLAFPVEANVGTFLWRIKSVPFAQIGCKTQPFSPRCSECRNFRLHLGFQNAPFSPTGHNLYYRNLARASRSLEQKQHINSKDCELRFAVKKIQKWYIINFFYSFL